MPKERVFFFFFSPYFRLYGVNNVYFLIPKQKCTFNFQIIRTEKPIIPFYMDFPNWHGWKFLKEKRNITYLAI